MNKTIADIITHDHYNVKGFFNEYRWLSNFHIAEVEYDGDIYPSSENAYQAAKCLHKSDRSEFFNISPSQSKKLGRQIAITQDWEYIKLDVMYKICRDKFIRNSDLNILLIETGDRYLEETNYWNDRFWGVCNGKGENNLGLILMKIREELINAKNLNII